MIIWKSHKILACFSLTVLYFLRKTFAFILDAFFGSSSDKMLAILQKMNNLAIIEIVKKLKHFIAYVYICH